MQLLTEVLTGPEKWCKNMLIKGEKFTENGDLKSFDQVCLVGAIAVVTNHLRDNRMSEFIIMANSLNFMKVRDMMSEVLQDMYPKFCGYIPGFNNDIQTTFDQVYQVAKETDRRMQLQQ